MLKGIQWLFSRITSNWDSLRTVAAWGWMLFGATMSGWAAWAANIFSTYSPFSWVAAAIFGGTLASVIAAAISWTKERIARATYLKSVAGPPVSVNPLRQDFQNEKILLSDFWHPLLEARKYQRRVFRDCDIYGPCSFTISGSGSMKNCGFSFCDMVAIRKGSLFAPIIFEDTHFYNCRFFNATIFLPSNLAEIMRDQFKASGTEQEIIGLNEIQEKSNGK